MKKIRRYCIPSSLLPRIVLLMFIAAGAALLYYGVQMYKAGVDTVGIVVTLLCSVLMFPIGVWVYNKSYRELRKGFDGRWELFRSKRLTPAIERDFNRGTRIYDGRLIVGSTCIMGKNPGLVVLYSEISAIRRHCHTFIYESGGKSHVGTLEITAGGKDYMICKMKKYEERSKDWDRLCSFIAYNHPSIYIDTQVKRTSKYVESTSSND